MASGNESTGMDTALGKFLQGVMIVLGTLAGSWLLDLMTPASWRIGALALCAGLSAFVGSKVVNALVKPRSRKQVSSAEAE